LPSLLSREKQTGDLTELQKAQLNWIIARQDRAWYAVGQAYEKLQSLGQSEDRVNDKSCARVLSMARLVMLWT